MCDVFSLSYLCVTKHSHTDGSSCRLISRVGGRHGRRGRGTKWVAKKDVEVEFCVQNQPNHETPCVKSGSNLKSRMGESSNAKGPQSRNVPLFKWHNVSKKPERQRENEGQEQAGMV